MEDRNVDTVIIGKSKMLSLPKHTFVYRRAGRQEFDVLFDVKVHSWEVFRGKWITEWV